MLRFLPYILKSLWGHRARTLLTISGAAVAMFSLSLMPRTPSLFPSRRPIAVPALAQPA